MSITWESLPVVSEVVVNGTTYYVKDAEARSIIETLSGNGLVTTVATSASTTPYGVQWTKEGQTITGTWQASDTSMPYLVLVPQDSVSGTYIEYVTARTGASEPYVYNWEKIGTTETDLSDYAKIEDLGDLAWKDTASGSIKASAIALANGTTTAAGSINVTLKDSTGATSITSTGSFTPSGSLSGSPLSENSVSKTGTAAAQTFTGEKYAVTVTPATNTVNHYSSVLSGAELDGTQSYTAPVLTPASATITASTGTFATSGVNATVNGEVLSFTDASTGFIDASKVTNFNGGSITQGSVDFGGISTTTATPTSRTFMTGATAALSKDNTGVQIEGTNAASSATVAVKEYAFDATELEFTGDSGSVSVSGTYNKQVIDTATFTGSASMVAGTVTAAGAQTVTVS